MKSPQDIIAEVREDVLSFQRQLQQKMVSLAQEGLLTEKDKNKIEYNMRSTIDALTRALQNQSYDKAFTKEWILQVVKRYENDIIKQINEVESRRYADKAIAARIERIEQNSFSEAPTVDRKGPVAAEITKLEKQLWEDVRGISQKHRRRSQLIEAWLQEFESDVQALLRPRIS